MTTTDPVRPGSTATAPRWQDPTLPAAERVELLLAEMSLEEKIGQLGSRWVGNDMGDDPADSGDGERRRRRAPAGRPGPPRAARPQHR